eukprot:COSAG05_NODE_133_length_17087_cov_268.363374_13_plen_357_part_00
MIVARSGGTSTGIVRLYFTEYNGEDYTTLTYATMTGNGTGPPTATCTLHDVARPICSEENFNNCVVLVDGECFPGACCGHFDKGCPPDCTTLSGPEAMFMQVLVGLLGAAGLVIKNKYSEKGRVRERRVWLMDVSKQYISMACCHFAGLTNAHVLNGATMDSEDHGNECSAYFISFCIDTSLGVGIAYGLLQSTQQLAQRGWGPFAKTPSLMQSGNYHKVGPLGVGASEQPDCGIWGKQLTAWCMINLVARAMCGLLMYALSDGLGHLSHAVATPFCGHRVLFLALVMLGGPVALNLLQLWVQDSFLQKKGPTPPPVTWLRPSQSSGMLNQGLMAKGSVRSTLGTLEGSVSTSFVV